MSDYEACNALIDWLLEHPEYPNQGRLLDDLNQLRNEVDTKEAE